MLLTPSKLRACYPFSTPSKFKAEYGVGASRRTEMHTEQSDEVGSRAIMYAWQIRLHGRFPISWPFSGHQATPTYIASRIQVRQVRQMSLLRPHLRALSSIWRPSLNHIPQLKGCFEPHAPPPPRGARSYRTSADSRDMGTSPGKLNRTRPLPLFMVTE